MSDDLGLDWDAIVLRGVETEEVDYKAAQNWRELSRAGKAKFARHCMALGNTKGGYIVVGVGEDEFGRPSLQTGLTDEQAKSWDPTDFGAFVNRCADPAIDFDLEKPVVDGRQYVVVVVRRFAQLPHVCVYSLNHELSQGAFYIRTKDASSRVAYRASEVHGLIQRALRNQRELLGRMLRGILYENRTEGGSQPYRDQLLNARRFLASRWPQREGDGGPSLTLEVAAYPGEFVDERCSLTRVREAIEASTYTFRRWPFAPLGSTAETYFSNTSLRSLVSEPRIHWQAFQSGLFHYQAVVELQPTKHLPYVELVHTVAEAVFFLGQYYGALNVDEETMTVDFQLDGTEDAGLVLGGDGGQEAVFVSRIPAIQYRLQRSGANLAADPVEHASRVVRQLAERFNMPPGQHPDLHGMIGAFLQRQMHGSDEERS